MGDNYPHEFIEVYEWPEGTSRPSTDCGLALLNGPWKGNWPQEGDVLILTGVEGDTDSYTGYRIIERHMLFVPIDGEDRSDQRILKTWVFVRKVDPDEVR